MAWWLVDSVLNGTMEKDYPVTEYPNDDPSYYGYEYTPLSGDSGEPFKQDFLADNDDQASHHFTEAFDHLMLNSEVQEKETMANYFKYHEEEILNDIEEYVSATYRGHYTGDTHEYRNVQTIDLMAARSLAVSYTHLTLPTIYSV